MSSAIPRFLLPRISPAWRLSSTRTFIRSASNNSKKASKPRVLEKPTKFNPPSHGSKPRKTTASYAYPGPQLSAEEEATRRTKKYPNMMPAEGTFLHWFLTSRSIHIYITLGTLTSLAIFTFTSNFRRTSPFADLLPSAGDLFFHPINFTRQCFEVLRLHTAATSAETAARRQRRTDDVAKRAEYRKKHGLETEAFGGWTAKDDKDVDDKIGTIGQFGGGLGGGDDNMSPQRQFAHGENIGTVVKEVLAADEGAIGHAEAQDSDPRQKRPIKKWLGIW